MVLIHGKKLYGTCQKAYADAANRKERREIG